MIFNVCYVFVYLAHCMPSFHAFNLPRVFVQSRSAGLKGRSLFLSPASVADKTTLATNVNERTQKSFIFPSAGAILIKQDIHITQVHSVKVHMPSTLNKQADPCKRLTAHRLDIQPVSTAICN